MESLAKLELERTLGVLPQSACVLASSFEGKRCGLLIRRVIQCADEPVCIAAAVPKGHRISTYIRDSHAFCLNVLGTSNRMIQRRFDGHDDMDPFDMLEVTRLATGAPVLARAVAAIDCEVMRRFDLEADYELYIGQVVSARLLNPVDGEKAAGAASVAMEVAALASRQAPSNGHGNGKGQGNGHAGGHGASETNGHVNGRLNGLNGDSHGSAGTNGSGPGPVIELPRPGRRGRRIRGSTERAVVSGAGEGMGGGAPSERAAGEGQGTASGNAGPLVSPIEDYVLPPGGANGPGGLGNLGPRVFEA